MLHIDCPNCGKTLRIPNEYIGQYGECNHCKNSFRVSVPGSNSTTNSKPVAKWLLVVVVIGVICSGVGVLLFKSQEGDGVSVVSSLLSTHYPEPGDADFEDYGLYVYEPVPGLEASEQYVMRVRTFESGSSWHDAFSFITRCKQGDGMKENHYFERLSWWTNTYINFEMNRPIEVEITRVNGEPIEKATPHPVHKVESCFVRDGKAYVVMNEPALVAVDIDGQMDDQNTGKGYLGPPIHTVTVFANPIIENRPEPDDPTVYAVKPNEQPPTDGDWETLYFLPGVHDIGVGFQLNSDKSYYIPGDALVHGTMNNIRQRDNGKNIHIFGYGTISGERIKHPRHVTPKPKNDKSYNPVRIIDADNVLVEGITIADSAHHSLQLLNFKNPNARTELRWAKVFTWRGNGDGIGAGANGLMEDCFMRTQDDSCYVTSGRGIRRTTYWNDWNGSAFVLTAIPNSKVIVEDCDVIYSRAGWHHWGGGRVFNMRGEGGGGGDKGAGVIFRNIRISDPRPTLQQFFITMELPKPYSGNRKHPPKRKPGDLSGILFQDIQITAPSVLGESDMLWGMENGKIHGITFDNVTIRGKRIRDIEHFKHNQHVKNIEFR